MALFDPLGRSSNLREQRKTKRTSKIASGTSEICGVLETCSAKDARKKRTHDTLDTCFPKVTGLPKGTPDRQKTRDRTSFPWLPAFCGGPEDASEPRLR